MLIARALAVYVLALASFSVAPVSSYTWLAYNGTYPEHVVMAANTTDGGPQYVCRAQQGWGGNYPAGSPGKLSSIDFPSTCQLPSDGTTYLTGVFDLLTSDEPLQWVAQTGNVPEGAVADVCRVQGHGAGKVSDDIPNQCQIPVDDTDSPKLYKDFDYLVSQSASTSVENSPIRVQAVPCSPSDQGQQGWSFKIIHYENFTGRVRGPGGLCLEPLGKEHVLVEGKGGTHLALVDCDGSLHQEFIYAGQPMYPFMFHHVSGHCVDIDHGHGPAVQIYGCNGHDNQNFTIEGGVVRAHYAKPQGVGAMKSADYCFTAEVSPGPTPPAPPAPPGPPAPPTPPPPAPVAVSVRGMPCDSSNPLQRGWSFERQFLDVSNGRIRGPGGLCVQTSKGGIELRTCTGESNQLFKHSALEPGTLKPADNQKGCVDIYQWHGPKVVIHSCTGKQNELFTFEQGMAKSKYSKPVAKSTEYCLTAGGQVPGTIARNVLSPRRRTGPAPDHDLFPGPWTPVSECFAEYPTRKYSICWTRRFGKPMKSKEGLDQYCTRTRPKHATSICAVRAFNDSGTSAHGIGGIQFESCKAFLTSPLTSPFYGEFTRYAPSERWKYLAWFNTTESDPMVRVLGRHQPDEKGMVYALWFVTKSGVTSRGWAGEAQWQHRPFNYSLGNGLVGAAGGCGNRLDNIWFKYFCDAPKPEEPEAGNLMYHADLQECGTTYVFQSWSLRKLPSGAMLLKLRRFLLKDLLRPVCLADVRQIGGAGRTLDTVDSVALVPCNRLDVKQQWHLDAHSVGGNYVRNHDKTVCLKMGASGDGTAASLAPCDQTASFAWFHDVLAYPMGMLRTMILDQKSQARKCLSARPDPALAGKPPKQGGGVCQMVSNVLPDVVIPKIGPMKVSIVRIELDDLTVQLGLTANFSRCAIYDPIGPLGLRSGTIQLALHLPAVSFVTPWVHFDHGPFGVHGTITGQGSTHAIIKLGIDYDFTQLLHPKIKCHDFFFSLSSDMHLELYGGEAWHGIADSLRHMIEGQVTTQLPKAVEKVLSKVCPIGDFGASQGDVDCSDAMAKSPVEYLQCASLNEPKPWISTCSLAPCYACNATSQECSEVPVGSANASPDLEQCSLGCLESQSAPSVNPSAEIFL